MKDYRLTGFIIIVAAIAFFAWFGWEDYPSEPPGTKVSTRPAPVDPAGTSLSKDYAVIWDKLKSQMGLVFPSLALDEKDPDYYARLFIAMNVGALRNPAIISQALAAISDNSQYPDLTEAQKRWLDRLGTNLSVVFTCQERLTRAEIDRTFDEFEAGYPKVLKDNMESNSLPALLNSNPCST